MNVRDKLTEISGFYLLEQLILECQARNVLQITHVGGQTNTPLTARMRAIERQTDR